MTGDRGSSEALRRLAGELNGLAASLDGGGSGASDAHLALLSRAEEALEACRNAFASGESVAPMEKGGALRILVVDDDDTSRNLLGQFLSRYGEVVTVASGADAVARVTRAVRGGSLFHLVFLDLMMPEMDGQETLERIRRLEEVYSVARPALVAMTTAVSDRGAVLQARKAGSEAYFVKPLDLGKLGAWVESLDLTPE